MNGQGDVEKAQRFIQNIQHLHQAVQEELEKRQDKYKEMHDKHQVDHQFQVGDQFWLYINNQRITCEGKNINPINYGFFKILYNIGTNTFHLDVPSYMHMYSTVNVENLKPYKPTMIIVENE